MSRGSARFGKVLCLALPVVVLAAAGWAAAASVVLPSPEELVPNTVARISDVSERDGTIARAEFRHALVLAAAADGRHAAPRPGERGYHRLERTAVDSLLEAIWLRGQAAEMNIVVTRRQVSRELALIKRESFRSAAEYRAFPKAMRYTRRDVYERVELQLLATRLQRRIMAGARSESEERKALEEFVAEFNERWRDRTVCAPEYVTARCSNGPSDRPL